jgi:hypothetical protein
MMVDQGVAYASESAVYRVLDRADPLSCMFGLHVVITSW